MANNDTDALFSQASSQAQNTSNDVLARVVGVASTIGNQAEAIATRVISSLNTAANTTITMVQTVLARVVTVTTTVVNAAMGVVRTVIDAAVATVRASVDLLVGAITAIVGVLTGATGLIIRTITGVVGAVGNLLNTGWEAILFAVSSFGRLLPYIFQIVRQVIALVNAASAVLTQVWGAITGAFPAIIGAAQNFIGVIGNGLTTVAAIVRNGLTAVATWAQTAWGFATNAGQFIVSHIGTVVGILGSLAETGLKAGTALLTVAGTGALLATFSAAVVGATQTMMQYAQQVKDLSALTGFSLKQSSSLIDRLGIQGIGPQSVQSVYSNRSPFVANLTAQAWGLPSLSSENFLESFSRRFQSMNANGPLGNLMNRAMVQSLGLGPEWTRAASTPIGIQRENTSFQKRIDSNLGLTPAALNGYANEAPAMVQRVLYAINRIVMVFASKVLPVVEQVLTTVTQYVGQNAGEIGSFIADAVKFMFVRVGPMFVEGITTLTDMIATGVDDILLVATWLATALPSVLGGITQTLADTLRAWSEAFVQWAPGFILGFAQFLIGIGNTLQNVVAGVGRFVVGGLTQLADFLLTLSRDSNNPFRVLVLEIARSLDGIINTVATFTNGISLLVTGLYNAFWGAIRGIPIVGQWAARNHQPIPYANVTVPHSNLYDTANNWFTGPGPINASRAVRGAAGAAQGFFDNAQMGIGQGTANIVNGVLTGGSGLGVGIYNALNGAGNFLASADGRRNVGRDIGQGVANLVRPTLEPLSRISQGVTDFSNAAQAYKQSLGTESERSQRWDEMVREQKRGNDLQQESNNLTRSLNEQVRQHGFSGLDRTAGIVLSEYSAARSAALKRRA